MIELLLKKELRVFFGSKGNLVVAILLPVMLLVIFGSALSSYMKTDYGTFTGGTVMYYAFDASEETMGRFQAVSNEIHAATGVTFEEIYEPEEARRQVEASAAYGLITITDSGLEYFRSAFNEPDGGKLVRSLFVQLAGREETGKITSIEKAVLSVEPIDSKAYYTFSSLAFSILFMGLIVGFSVNDEKLLCTIERISLSRAGVWRMLAAKIAAGVICGLVQTAAAMAFSTAAYQVNWGEKALWIVFLFAMLSLYSSLFGCVAGMLCRSKSSCQNIVLTVSMLSGYLGGSITPLYLLENAAIMNIIINISPLYWVNRAVTNLCSGMLNESFAYAVMVLAGLVLVVASIGYVFGRKSSNCRATAKEASV